MRGPVAKDGKEKSEKGLKVFNIKKGKWGKEKKRREKAFKEDLKRGSFPGLELSHGLQLKCHSEA